MMKAHFITGFLIFILSVQITSAQSNYVTHTLKQGETLSMLAKQYNTNVGDIMRLNGMHADTKLVYGSPIKIPSSKLTTATERLPATAANTAMATKPANPLLHTVAEGETLYSISKKYNVSVEQLKAWNNITDNSAKLGTAMIVGANLANNIIAEPAQPAETTQPAQETITSAPPEPVATQPQQQQAATPNTNADVQPVTENKPAAAPTEQQANDNTTASVAQPMNSNYSGAGFFEDQFVKKNTNQMETVSGITKTFKTASGWADGKYYILANNINPGTIVKITADNGNSVYAKVLWNMGDMKQNTGISFRVSNATAAALQENSDSFNLNVSY